MSMNIQPEFLELVNASLCAAKAAFGERLSAFFLHGSIALGDAVPGISDLDAMLLLGDGVSQDDLAVQQELQASLQAQFPVADEVHLTLMCTGDLAQNAFACFALKYNASLLYGSDVTAAFPCPAPDKAMAKSRLGFARQCFDEALRGEQPACTGPLPEDTFYRARKFARYFVIIEGAYFLMAQNAFASFRKEDVLPALFAAAPQFSQALTLTKSVLHDAQNAMVDAQTFLSAISTLVKWMFDQIDNA